MALLLLLCAADFPDFAKPGPPPGQLELAQGWSLVSARNVPADGAALSMPTYRAAGWHAIPRMPATVLQTLQEDGTYPDLYYGTNLGAVPQDLYKQDWWYRTTFTAPAGHTTYLLEFPGINYRAEVWLNGHLIAGNTQIVGMHTAHELDVSRWMNQGASNTLAVKVTPERALQDIDGVELADSWYDWINWNYLGYQGPGKNPANGNSFVADRNAGHLEAGLSQASGSVVLGPATVNTELPLPRTDSARLTIHTSRPQLLHAAGARRAAGDDHPSRASRHRASSSRSRCCRGRAPRGQLHPRRVRAADRRRTRTCGGRTPSASPTSTTCGWSSGSTTGRPTPAICGSVSAPFSNTATTTSSSPNWARAATST